ncbi:hypothetical protein [Kaistia defluvii]|uniref:Uncharacterized protein n=1 Tax=Kaistia defluvii TaxID=410841 RepID=A0ABV2R2N3_9HYPH
MGEPVESVDVVQSALDHRVQSLLDAHNGDALAVIETLLLAVDSREERVSFGFVRGRLPALTKQGE